MYIKIRFFLNLSKYLYLFSDIMALTIVNDANFKERIENLSNYERITSFILNLLTKLNTQLKRHALTSRTYKLTPMSLCCGFAEKKNYEKI